MKKTEKKKFREKEIADLRKDLVNTKKDLVILSLERVAGKVKNFHEVRGKRRLVAFLLTLIKEKEMLEEIKT